MPATTRITRPEGDARKLTIGFIFISYTLVD
jgi:hypothetical protein